MLEWVHTHTRRCVLEWAHTYRYIDSVLGWAHRVCWVGTHTQGSVLGWVHCGGHDAVC